MLVGRLLKKVADEGVQVFLFTGHLSVSQLFEQLSIPSMVVRQTVLDGVSEHEYSEPDPRPTRQEEPDWIPVEYRVVSARISPNQQRRVGLSPSPRGSDSVPRETAGGSISAADTPTVARRADAGTECYTVLATASETGSPGMWSRPTRLRNTQNVQAW